LPQSDLSSLRGLRVLVVDDDADARMIVRRSLAEHGVDVSEAASMDEALAAMQLHHPEVMVSDIGMPVNDGYKLIRTLRERGIDAATLPAIALTAFIQPDDRARGVRQRVSGAPAEASGPRSAEDCDRKAAPVESALVDHRAEFWRHFRPAHSLRLHVGRELVRCRKR
jgi:CheY-like chemotaxis protein